MAESSGLISFEMIVTDFFPPEFSEIDADGEQHLSRYIRVNAWKYAKGTVVVIWLTFCSSHKWHKAI